jgi:hypothetical protein
LIHNNLRVGIGVESNVHRMQGWVGRKDRQAVAVDAVVHSEDRTETPVKLTDISDEGCRIEAARDFRIGEQVEIAIPDIGRVGAQIRWALMGSAGAKFLDDQPEV